jgi:hypothetical protein
MEALKNWLRIGLPSGWAEVTVRTLMAAVAAFAALMIKERMDAPEWDSPACAVDAAWVAGGTLVLNAILALVSPRERSAATP